MYDIDFDEEARILTLTQSGFWDTDMVHKYVADVSMELERLDRRYGDFDILTDNRDFPVQSAEVTEAFGEFTRQSMEQSRKRRVAIISPNTLSKLQAQRVADAPNVRVFRDEIDARQWLTEERRAGSGND